MQKLHHEGVRVGQMSRKDAAEVNLCAQVVSCQHYCFSHWYYTTICANSGARALQNAVYIDLESTKS